MDSWNEFVPGKLYYCTVRTCVDEVATNAFFHVETETPMMFTHATPWRETNYWVLYFLLGEKVISTISINDFRHWGLMTEKTLFNRDFEAC